MGEADAGRGPPMTPPFLETVLVDGAERLLRLAGVVPLGAGQRIGRWAGRLAFACDRRHREIVIDNLERTLGAEFPPGAIRSLARRVFLHLGQLPFELCWSLRLRPADRRRYFRLTGRRHYQDALARGKGVLMLTAHMGNWELLPIVGAMTRLPVHIVFRPLDVPLLDRLIGRLRSRFGAGLIPAQNGLFAILRALRQGECAALLMDQNVDWYDGVFVDFFGRRACTGKGLAMIALRTGAPVVPVFLARETGGFVVEFGPPVPPVRSGDALRDLEDTTQRYNRVIEAFVRRHPEQWFWAHRRWKTRPYRPWPRQVSSSDVQIPGGAA